MSHCQPGSLPWPSACRPGCVYVLQSGSWLAHRSQSPHSAHNSNYSHGTHLCVCVCMRESRCVYARTQTYTHTMAKRIFTSVRKVANTVHISDGGGVDSQCSTHRDVRHLMKRGGQELKWLGQSVNHLMRIFAHV